MRLIDADVLCDNHTRLAYESNYDFHITARAWVEKQPTIDAVPVVRCKDCRKWCICHKGDDWFCADGERNKVI